SRWALSDGWRAVGRARQLNATNSILVSGRLLDARTSWKPAQAWASRHFFVIHFRDLSLSSNLFLSPLAGYTNLPFRLVVREIGGVGLCTTDLVNARSLLEKNPKALKLIETRPADSPLAVQLFGSVPEEMRDAAMFLESVGVAAIFVHGRTREQGFGGTVNLAGIRAVVQAVKTIPVIGNGDIITPQAAKKMFDETGCAGVSIGRGAFYDPWIFRRTVEYLQ